jgi:hypothetical protein
LVVFVVLKRERKMGQYLELAQRAAARLAAAHATAVGKTGQRMKVPAAGEVLILEPGHRLAGFDWDAAGFEPGGSLRIIDGIRHKRNDCSSRRAWRHVWGDILCLDCWPPTDTMAVVNTFVQAPVSTTVDARTGKSSGFAQGDTIRSLTMRANYDEHRGLEGDSSLGN